MKKVTVTVRNLDPEAAKGLWATERAKVKSLIQDLPDEVLVSEYEGTWFNKEWEEAYYAARKGNDDSAIEKAAEDYDFDCGRASVILLYSERVAHFFFRESEYNFAVVSFEGDVELVPFGDPRGWLTRFVDKMKALDTHGFEVDVVCAGPNFSFSDNDQNLKLALLEGENDPNQLPILKRLAKIEADSLKFRGEMVAKHGLAWDLR